MKPQSALHCPLCGQPNQCAPALAGSFEVDCWCRQVKVETALLQSVPEQQRGCACLCAACIAAGADARRASDE